jgi:transcriptional antiterminator Rof (Rho-off)
MSDYKNVSCDFYDELTNAILLKQVVEIFTEGKIHIGLLKDVYTENKEEFCIINDVQIRLDKILSMTVDGMPVKYLQDPSCEIPK